MLVGAALLLLSGLAYRGLAARFAALTGTVPLPLGTLEGLPLQIGEWSGEIVPLPPRIVEATDTDDHLSRLYTPAPPAEPVSLYIAYGVHFRDLMPHRPEVCYPASGWQRESGEIVQVDRASGPPVSAQLQVFGRAGLDPARITVLSYYDVSGSLSADISQLRSLTGALTTRLRYVAQVQISATSWTGERARSRAAVLAFAESAVPAIETFMAEVVDKHDPTAPAGSEATTAAHSPEATP